VDISGEFVHKYGRDAVIEFTGDGYSTLDKALPKLGIDAYYVFVDFEQEDLLDHAVVGVYLGGKADNPENYYFVEMTNIGYRKVGTDFFRKDPICTTPLTGYFCDWVRIEKGSGMCWLYVDMGLEVE